MMAVSATPIDTIPPVSSRIPGCATVCGNTRIAPANAAMPIGTLIKNTSRHPIPHRLASISAPARTGAARMERPITGPKAPNTLVISLSSKTSLIIPNPWGIISAPNEPCSTRNTINTSIEGATEQAADITVKPADPIRNSRRRPNMSPRRAPVIKKTAKASV
jgi:hypothetical protein